MDRSDNKVSFSRSGTVSVEGDAHHDFGMVPTGRLYIRRELGRGLRETECPAKLGPFTL